MLEKINKIIENSVAKGAVLDDVELAKINKYTIAELTAEQVYVFKAVLCDNDVDRDLENFSDGCLDKFAELFLGKTMISDHKASSENQTARIYATEVETVLGKQTALGTEYKRLIAHCYMVKTAGNADRIAEIDGGIKKEVSVSASCSEANCSICGENQKKRRCGHKKGQLYNGKQCSYILDAPTDAYEVSFVAVPAQRKAGVTKQSAGAEEYLTESEDDISKEIGLLKLKAAILSKI